MPILVVRLWRSFFYKIKMKKHFLERLLIVIITLVVVFLLGFLFIVIVPGNASIERLYQTIYFILFMIVLVVLGLVLDSIVLYRKQERDKAKASLLVSFVSLLILYFFLSYFWLFVFLFIDGNEYLK